MLNTLELPLSVGTTCQSSWHEVGDSPGSTGEFTILILSNSFVFTKAKRFFFKNWPRRVHKKREFGMGIFSWPSVTGSLDTLLQNRIYCEFIFERNLFEFSLNSRNSANFLIPCSFSKNWQNGILVSPPPNIWIGKSGIHPCMCLSVCLYVPNPQLK